MLPMLPVDVRSPDDPGVRSIASPLAGRSASWAEIRRRLGLVLLSGTFSVALAILLVASYECVASRPVAEGRGNIELQDYVRDAQLGWRLPAQFQWIFRTQARGPGVVYFATDRLGLRNDALEPPENSHTLLLGDSFAQGYFLAQHETISAALARRVNAPVYNLGVGGYSTDQEYTLLKRVLRERRTRFVAVLFYANDLLYLDQDRAWDTEKPVYRIEEARVDFDTLRPIPAALLTQPVLPEPTRAADGVTLDDCCFLPEGASLFRRFWVKATGYARLAGRPLDLFRAVRKGIRLTKEGSYKRELPERAYFDAHALQREWNLASQFLVRIRDLATSKGAETIVLMIPEAAQIQLGPSGERFYPQRQFLETCRSNGLRCVEPSARFLAEHGHRPLYFADDVHFTPAGAELASELLAREIAGAH